VVGTSGASFSAFFATERYNIFDVRRILLFPFGNSQGTADSVSLYLEHAEPKQDPKGWHACAQLALAMSNVNDPSVYTVSCMF
jgi:hypothetical protein